jgi:hypothetical protein
MENMKIEVKEAPTEQSSYTLFKTNEIPTVSEKHSPPIIKKRTLLKTLTKETLGNEATQGLLRIFDTPYTILKIFWLISLLGCGSLCAYLVLQTLIAYLSYPVYTTTTTVHEIPTDFPKITICNSMLAITEYAYEMIKEINEEMYPDVNIFNQSQIGQISFWNEAGPKFWDVYSAFLARINSASFSDVERQKLSHSFNDFLIYCYFNGRQCDEIHFIWKWDPRYGNCYSFNSGVYPSGESASYKQSSLPGIDLGLQLLLYVGYNDKLNVFNCGYNSWIPYSNSYGVNIRIENNTYSTHNKQNVIALNGGTINYMPLQRRFSSKLPNPYSNCDIDNTNPGYISSPYYNLILNSPYQYSQDLCVIQCIQQHVIRLCNCSMQNYLDLYNVSCKSADESKCANWFFYHRNLSTIVQECMPQCPLECNSTEISYMLTSQTFSGNGYAYLVNESPVYSSDFTTTPVTEATASNKFLQLFVYYESLSFTSSEDSPSMDIVAFLGNVGGTLGLFLGVSALSLCELIHLIVESCILLSTHSKNSHKITDSNI